MSPGAREKEVYCFQVPQLLMFRCPLLSVCHLAAHVANMSLLLAGENWAQTSITGQQAETRVFFHQRWSMMQLANESGEIYSSVVCSPVQWHVWQQEVWGSARRHGDYWDRKSCISSFICAWHIYKPTSFDQEARGKGKTIIWSILSLLPAQGAWDLRQQRIW